MSTCWDQVDHAIGSAIGEAYESMSRTPIAGGCINSAHRLSGRRREFFIKLNDATRLDMFEAERSGLEALAASHSIRVPAPVCTGVAEGRAYLVLEYVALGPVHSDTAERLGRDLAELHRSTGPRFGWHRDNTIGATAQHNDWHADWVVFFTRHRMQFQLALAARHGFGKRIGERGAHLAERIGAFFEGGSPVPSLLHGDLWAGNHAADETGTPVVFDPAVYYGDRETDLAMTELFGGFPERFYDAYDEAWPLPEEYRVRKHLYNLYHVLNHLNLFGESYLAQATAMIDMLLAEIDE